MTGNSAFSGPGTRGYAAAAARNVPGLDGLHRMTAQLLGETVPPDGRILVLGAGGGLELRALAQAHPGWHLDGIDPSADMLDTARQTIGPLADRIDLHQGYAPDAPAGPFDATVCFLTFHFIPRDDRLPTLRALHSRLRPGAPLALAHISFAQTEPDRARWIARHVAYGAAESTDAAGRAASQAAIATRLTILDPEEEEAMLRAAGFADITPYWHALSFRGWIARAA